MNLRSCVNLISDNVWYLFAHSLFEIWTGPQLPFKINTKDAVYSVNTWLFLYSSVCLFLLCPYLAIGPCQWSLPDPCLHTSDSLHRDQHSLVSLLARGALHPARVCPTSGTCVPYIRHVSCFFQLEWSQANSSIIETHKSPNVDLINMATVSISVILELHGKLTNPVVPDGARIS